MMSDSSHTLATLWTINASNTLATLHREYLVDPIDVVLDDFKSCQIDYISFWRSSAFLIDSAATPTTQFAPLRKRNPSPSCMQVQLTPDA